ncbi:Major Facilitator Superfamily protein [Amycolatopsis arida]|uniref:Major Facilitator Superfamily protein n=1 Tax=Amycolatopsis arida TaxID=587909 RepID=A0A1I5ZHU5_9PSEU|nr:MFS transporter [Amycolatopsis arida]SFQ56059.1 Major Facilitator Superfamily protein [Amycolatopsis arida]
MTAGGPLRQPGFARLWLAALGSETAEWMLQVALPVLVYQRTGSPVATATGLMLGLLPAVLLGPVAGVLADRWNRRALLRAVCVGQAVVVLPLLGAGGVLAVVYAVLTAQAALAALFEPARGALVPELVGPERVVAANGLLGVGSAVARFAGGALGGLLLAAAGLGWLVAAYLALLAGAAALLLRPFAPVSTRAAGATASTARPGSPREWLAGFAAFVRRPALRLAGVALVLMAVAQGMFLVLFVLFVVDVLGGGEAEVGMLRGVQAVGGLLAGVALATVARRAAPARLLGGGVLSVGALSAVIWTMPEFSTALPVYIGLFAAVGAPGVVAVSGLLALLQTGTAAHLTGRVLSSALAGMALGTVAGVQLAGALAGAVGLAQLLLAQAALHVAAGAVILLGPGRYRGRRAPSVRHQRPARHAPRQRPGGRHHPPQLPGGLADRRRGRRGAGAGDHRHAGDAAGTVREGRLGAG